MQVCYCTSGWSLAAAETGRMIDVRSASAKARAVPLSSCAGGSQSQTQSRSSLRFDNIHNPLLTTLRENAKLFICGQSHGPCRTLLSPRCGLTMLSVIATALQVTTGYHRSAARQPTSSSARAHKPIRLGWYKGNKGAQLSPPQLVSGQIMYALREATATTCRPQRLALGASLEPAVSHLGASLTVSGAD
jgi:hypothetical protein